MIEVKLEDFEKYRSDLNSYATNLLNKNGFGNFKKAEIPEIAKDIVQDTYLQFHKFNLDSFVSEFHLINYLRIALYRCYQNQVNFKRPSYNSLKDHNQTDSLENNIGTLKIEENFDFINAFSNKLSKKQKDILHSLLDGYTQKEIVDKFKLKHQVEISRELDNIRDIYLNKKKEPSNPFVKPQKKIKQLDHNSVVIKIWDGVNEAADKLDLSASAISNCCNGKRLTHGNFKWEFVH
jgi:DNA-directed RNA polymerase specialized sigma24 family protein